MKASHRIRKMQTSKTTTNSQVKTKPAPQLVALPPAPEPEPAPTAAAAIGSSAGAEDPIESRVHRFGHPICISWGGLHYLEMTDAKLLRFLCRFIAHNGDTLRGWMLPRITDVNAALELAQAISVGEDIYDGEGSLTDGDAVESICRTAAGKLYGLASCTNPNADDVLFLIGQALYRNRALIEVGLIPTSAATTYDRIGEGGRFDEDADPIPEVNCLGVFSQHIHIYHALVAAEAIAARGFGWTRDGGDWDRQLTRRAKGCELCYLAQRGGLIGVVQWSP